MCSASPGSLSVVEFHSHPVNASERLWRWQSRKSGRKHFDPHHTHIPGAGVSVDSDQLIRMSIAKGLQQHAINHGEHYRARSGAEGERQHSHRGKSRPQGVTENLPEILDPAGASRVAALFLNLFLASELDTRQATRLFRSVTARDRVRGMLIEVKTQLFLQLRLHLISVHRRRIQLIWRLLPIAAESSRPLPPIGSSSRPRFRAACVLTSKPVEFSPRGRYPYPAIPPRASRDSPGDVMPDKGSLRNPNHVIGHLL